MPGSTQDETFVDYAAWLDTLPRLPSNPTAEQREAYVLDLAKSMTAAVLLTQAQQREGHRVMRECTEALSRALAMLERVEAELQRVAARPVTTAPADDEVTAPLARLPTGEVQSPLAPAVAAREMPTWSEGAVHVIEALSKLVASFPWPMWAILAGAIFVVALGTYGLVYSDGDRTIGAGGATAEKVNAVEDVGTAPSIGGGPLIGPEPEPH